MSLLAAETDGIKYAKHSAELAYVAGINWPYEDLGYVTSDPGSWDTNAGKDQSNMDEESSQLHPRMLYGWTPI